MFKRGGNAPSKFVRRNVRKKEFTAQLEEISSSRSQTANENPPNQQTFARNLAASSVQLVQSPQKTLVVSQPVQKVIQRTFEYVNSTNCHQQMIFHGQQFILNPGHKILVTQEARDGILQIEPANTQFVQQISETEPSQIQANIIQDQQQSIQPQKIVMHPPDTIIKRITVEVEVRKDRKSSIIKLKGIGCGELTGEQMQQVLQQVKQQPLKKGVKQFMLSFDCTSTIFVVSFRFGHLHSNLLTKSNTFISNC